MSCRKTSQRWVPGFGAKFSGRSVITTATHPKKFKLNRKYFSRESLAKIFISPCWPLYFNEKSPFFKGQPSAEVRSLVPDETLSFRWKSWRSLVPVMEVEGAKFFRAQADLKLWVLSPNKPEPVQIILKPASSFLLIKMLKIEFEATLSLLDNQAREPGAYLLEPKIRPGPSSPNPGSFHL